MKITLVRHGQSEANRLRIVQGHKDFPLSELGKEQAKELAEFFKSNNYQFDKVYSSDMIRAKETAQFFVEALDLKEITYDSRLRELNIGIYQGKPMDDMTSEDNAFLRACWKDSNKRIPGGETLNEMTARIREAFTEIINTNNNGTNILIVGHGGTLYHILHFILGIFPETDEWFDNCKLNEIIKDEESNIWKFIIFNGKKIN